MRLASGSWEVTVNQFLQLWLWMSVLILGFAVQVGLYTRLRRAQKEGMHAAVTGTSAAASGAAMVVCCAHHAVEVLPILGLSGAAIFLAEYQEKFLILGAFMNVLGIIYIYRQLNRATGAPVPGSSANVGWPLVSLAAILLVVFMQFFSISVHPKHAVDGSRAVFQISKASAAEIYPEFTCPCCGTPLNKENPCCG